MGRGCSEEVTPRRSRTSTCRIHATHWQRRAKLRRPWSPISCKRTQPSHREARQDPHRRRRLAGMAGRAARPSVSSAGSTGSARGHPPQLMEAGRLPQARDPAGHRPRHAARDLGAPARWGGATGWRRGSPAVPAWRNSPAPRPSENPRCDPRLARRRAPRGHARPDLSLALRPEHTNQWLPRGHSCKASRSADRPPCSRPRPAGRGESQTPAPARSGPRGPPRRRNSPKPPDPAGHRPALSLGHPPARPVSRFRRPRRFLRHVAELEARPGRPRERSRLDPQHRFAIRAKIETST